MDINDIRLEAIFHIFKTLILLVQNWKQKIKQKTF
jgi:hypothetical protein